jgi:hypothetical protein
LSEVMRVELSLSYTLVTPSQRGGERERGVSPLVLVHANRPSTHTSTNPHSWIKHCICSTVEVALALHPPQTMQYFKVYWNLFHMFIPIVVIKVKKSKTKMSFYLTLLCGKAFNFLIFLGIFVS